VNAQIRALFVNSGILGHATVARMIADAAALDAGIAATHIDLSKDMTTAERVRRRIFCAGPKPGDTTLAALTFARWRHEMHAGVQAALRIGRAEREDGRFDVIHFHTQATAYGSLRRMRRTPSIVSIDTTQTLVRAEAKSPIAYWGFAPSIRDDNAVFRAAAAITVTSDWAARDLLTHTPQLEPKVHVVPWAVLALDEFDAEWAEQRSASTTARPVRVLFMGGDFPRKGGFELLDVWRESGFGERASLKLVTSWPLESARLPAGVEQVHGLDAHSDDWVRAWRDADIFVLPARSEAFGIVLQEAAAAGIPVIAPRQSAIPEIVMDNVTGLLYEPGNLAEFARALSTLIDSPDLRHRLGSAARQRIEEAGRTEHYADRLNALIHDVADKHV
jgi:starch synthase